MGKNSWSQCKIYGLSDEEKERQRMNFQDWETGEQRMDVRHEKMEEYGQKLEKGVWGREGIQAVASGWEESDGWEALENLPQGTGAHPPVLALKWLWSL